MLGCKVMRLQLLLQMACFCWLSPLTTGQEPKKTDCDKAGETQCGCPTSRLLLQDKSSDDEALQSDWIQIEDMVLPRPKPRGSASAADDVGGKSDEPPKSAIKLWPGGIVFYVIDDAFKKSYQDFIRESLATIERQVGSNYIEFKEARTKSGKICRKNYVHFVLTNTNECMSKVGLQVGGPTELWLDQEFCLHTYTVQHEMLHAMGRMHEHTRPDRDKYLTIYFHEIFSPVCSNFDFHPEIIDLSHSQPYDYKSIMQYRSCAGSCRGNYVMLNKQEGKPFPANFNMSDMDAKKARFMYPAERKVTYSDRLCRDEGDSSAEEEPVVIVVGPRPRGNDTEDGVGVLRAWPIMVGMLAAVAMAVSMVTALG